MNIELKHKVLAKVPEMAKEIKNYEENKFLDGYRETVTKYAANGWNVTETFEICEKMFLNHLKKARSLNLDIKVIDTKIAYEAIFTAAGLDTSKLDRTQLKRKRDIVKARLDYFKLQGFIEDYTEYKTGRQAGGVEIVF